MKIRHALLPLFLLAGCASAAPPTAHAGAAHVAHPGLWKVADADTTIYLFGTIHVLPKDYVWESARLRDIVSTSNELVIETVIGKDPQTSAALLLGMGQAPGLPPLVDRVPPAKKAALQGIIARSGLPPKLLDGMKTWTAALMLVAVTLTDLGVEAQSGVEEQLKTQFGTKPISGLEKPEEQLGYLNSLSEEDQRAFLVTLVDDPKNGRIDFDKMLAAWSRGDQKAIARTFDKDPEMTPKLRGILIDRRNAAWTGWLKARMAKPGTVLVAVGAGHLAGPGSVPERLKAQGLTVTRIE